MLVARLLSHVEKSFQPIIDAYINLKDALIQSDISLASSKSEAFRKALEEMPVSQREQTHNYWAILHKTSKSNQLYYPDAASTEQCITEVLKLDIRGSTQKRGEDGKGLYFCRLGVINVEFRVKDGVAIVESITKSTDDDTRMKQVSYTR